MSDATLEWGRAEKIRFDRAGVVMMAVANKQHACVCEAYFGNSGS